MSTIETNHISVNFKGQSNAIHSIVPLVIQQSHHVPSSPLPLINTPSLPSSPSPFNDDKQVEKFYKKEKQISFEFDQLVKGMDMSHISSLPERIEYHPPFVQRISD